MGDMCRERKTVTSLCILLEFKATKKKKIKIVFFFFENQIKLK